VTRGICGARRDLNNELEKEGEGLVANRGFITAIQEDKWLQENQLFLMYIPDPLRKQLEQKMLRQVEQVGSVVAVPCMRARLTSPPPPLLILLCSSTIYLFLPPTQLKLILIQLLCWLIPQGAASTEFHARACT
jgi:hypothetical protein